MHVIDEDIIPITVPKWGLSMEEGVIVEWLVKPGHEVKEGEALLEIETSKIANSVEASHSGLIRRIVADAGTTVLVGQLIGVIADVSVPDVQIEAYIEEFIKSHVPAATQDEEGSNYKFVDVDSKRTKYVSIEHEDKSNLPVLFIHGFGGDCDNWMFNIAELGENHSVYALDLPGHGGSSKVMDDGSILKLAKNVIDFMDATNLKVAHLIGHSLGAAVVMEVARIQEGRVASLALLAPCGLGDTINDNYISGFVKGEGRRELKNTLALLFSDKSLVSRDMVNNILKYKRTDGVTEALKNIAELAFPGGKQAHSYRDLLSSLRSLSISIIWGDADEIADPRDCEGLHKSIAVSVLEGVGHMPHMEAASRVNELLLAHVSNIGELTRR
jgi:pyruvate dehydrogenase E2 component (dihydrolipoamide acetyltransferase)